MRVTSIPIFNDNYVHAIINNTDCIVVDPGDAQPVIEHLTSNNLSLKQIVLTHHHHDHIGGVKKLKQKYGCDIVGPDYDKHRIPDMDITLKDGDVFKLFDYDANIIYTPGHTLGHICYYVKKANTLFCGDTLFSMGCGYLFEGSPQQMWDSLSKLAKLPPETKVYCTHEYTLDNLAFALSEEPNNQDLINYRNKIQELRRQGLFSVPSLMEAETRLNPFLKAGSGEAFKALRERKNQFKAN